MAFVTGFGREENKTYKEFHDQLSGCREEGVPDYNAMSRRYGTGRQEYKRERGKDTVTSSVICVNIMIWLKICI